MELSNLRPAEGSKHKAAFRKGRGHGSGNGKTAGYGSKGQKARTGSPRPGFEGGQMPLYRRLPKRGFTNINRKEYAVINVAALDKIFADGDVISPEVLLEKRIIKDLKSGVKVLGQGSITKKVTVKASKFSESAKEKIEACGGTCEVI